MRLLLIVLLLAACSSDNAPASFNTHIDGSVRTNVTGSHF